MENNQENSTGIAEQVEKILAESRIIYGGIGGSTGLTYTGNGATISTTGLTYTSNGATISTAAPYWSGGSTVMAGKLDLNGDNADININGVSLTKTLSVLEERLNILVPKPELEKEWDELKALGDEYRKKSEEFEEKSRMWKTLKQIT
jgi:uncharacterized protein with beta-barrel porin domain